MCQAQIPRLETRQTPCGVGLGESAGRRPPARRRTTARPRPPCPGKTSAGEGPTNQHRVHAVALHGIEGAPTPIKTRSSTTARNSALWSAMVMPGTTAGTARMIRAGDKNSFFESFWIAPVLDTVKDICVSETRIPGVFCGAVALKKC